MIPVVTRDEMRAIDAAASDPVEVLVERAGAAVARAALEMLGGAYGRRVVVLAGPGNNGADGRVAAERLRERGAAVRVYDARDMPHTVPACDLVIDAAFGTGFRGTWTPPDVGHAQVLAVDVPTGLDADTGVAPPSVLRADRTVTFAAAKPGHFIGDGPDVVGELTVADIGLRVDAAMGVVEAIDVSAWLPRRERRDHKWRHAVRLVAGSPGMTGAAALAAGAAQRTGAGMVVASSPGVDDSVLAARFPAEVVTRPVAHVDWSGDVLSDIDRFGALVIGPGLGRQAAMVDAVVRSVAVADRATVVDGDALYAIGNDSGGLAVLRDRTAPTVLTPHDGEFAQLTGAPPGPDRCRRRATSGRRHSVGRPAQGADDDRRRAWRPRRTSSSTATRAWPPPARVTCSPASSAPCWRWVRLRSKPLLAVRGSMLAPVPRWHPSVSSPVI